MKVSLTRTAIAASLALASCNTEDRTLLLANGDEGVKPAPPPEGLNSALATVTGGTLVSGFKHGRLRKELDVAGFSISRRPITVGQYRTCMDAEVCTGPTHGCANIASAALDGADSDAALCVGEDNARAYCAWSGGRLPALSEWMFAARGPSPQRFSWGDGSATCEQHPLARERVRQLRRPAKEPTRAPARAPMEAVPAASVTVEIACTEPRVRRFEVGKHAAGASPFGLEDVLLSEAELIDNHPESHFSACAGTERGCMVYGLLPGAIDAVKPTHETSEAINAHPYAFRCVWSKEGS